MDAAVERLEQTILREIKRGRIPGVVIALVRGTAVVWARGYGVADAGSGQPMTADTVFSIQSLTKPVVATALMQCYERGGFSLDDAANRHLGGVIRNEFEDTAPVTIRQLMTHTSGLPADTGTFPPAGQRTLREFVSLMAKTVRRPGEEIVYANWGYDALGLLIEQFCGAPWDVYVSENISRPLGMRTTWAGRPPEGARVATGHFLSAVDGQLHRAEEMAYRTIPPTSAGSLYSTVEDMARFLIAHLNGGRCGGSQLLRPETATDMHQLHATAGRSNGGMGLGFRVGRPNARHLICHGGDGLGFTNIMGGYPEEQVGVVFSLNRGSAQTARSVIANTALQVLLGGDGQRRSRPGTRAAGLDGLAGAYTSTYWDIKADLTIEDGRPVLAPKEGLVVSGGEDNSYLEAIDDDVFLARGGMFDGFELTFERGGGPGDISFFGGVYPFRFDRQGDVAPAAMQPVDEDAVLLGRWRGTAATPMGPMAVGIEVTSPAGGRVSTPFAQGVAIEECVAEAGRVSGRFGLTVPGFGEMQMFPRLSAIGGKLQGRVYARTGFGEIALALELDRV